MQPIKIIIEIRDGNLTAVRSNINLHYILIDHDIIEKGTPTVCVPFEPDSIGDTLYSFYNDPFPEEQEIREALKRLKF